MQGEEREESKGKKNSFHNEAEEEFAENTGETAMENRTQNYKKDIGNDMMTKNQGHSTTVSTGKFHTWIKRGDNLNTFFRLAIFNAFFVQHNLKLQRLFCATKNLKRLINAVTMAP